MMTENQQINVDSNLTNVDGWGKLNFFIVWQHPNVFNRKPFVRIAETLFTAIFSKENIRKNGKKTKNVKTSKKNFSVNSKDMMTWVCLDENMSPRSVLNTLSYSQTYYS